MDKAKITNIIIVSVAIIAIIINIQYCQKKELQSDNLLLINVGDTLSKRKNKDGSETAKIALLESYNTKLILKLNTQDETIKSLQNIINKNKERLGDQGSVTVFSTSTVLSDTQTTTVTVVDSSTVYSACNKDSTWIKWSTLATKDSTHLDLKVNNAYSVIIGSERSKWYKKKTSFVEVTNSNPYTSTQALRAFKVKDNRVNRISIGLQGGYGITLRGLSPYLGLGINFKLL